MRTILILLKKEFWQIFRNRTMLPIIFVMPIVQLLVLVHAATFEMKHIRLAVVDADHSASSRGLVSKFRGSPFYQVVGQASSVREGLDWIEADRVVGLLVLPPAFERQLMGQGQASVQLMLNAIDGQVAGLVQAYTQSIVQDYNRQIVLEAKHLTPPTEPIQQIETSYRFWYNPQLNYATFMVPGILVLLVTIIGMFLAGLNLVREKEIGTIEQINVSPIRKYQFIVGKLLPFWIIALFELAFGLALGWLIFRIPVEGSLGLLFFAAGLYLLVVLGMGLFLSTFADTQQQSMFVAWFLVMIFILMSGLFTAIESMPAWAQTLTRANPVAYFIRITRMILLKGSGLYDILPELLSLAVYSVLIISLAVFRYRKTS